MLNIGRIYWVNHRTRETSWQPPIAPCSRPLPSGWEIRVDPQSSRPFFLNHQDGTTHWDIPESAFQTAQGAPNSNDHAPRPRVSTGGAGFLLLNNAHGSCVTVCACLYVFVSVDISVENFAKPPFPTTTVVVVVVAAATITTAKFVASEVAVLHDRSAIWTTQETESK